MSVRHLLVTNDFPPKVGGIQTCLYDLWSRLPPDEFAVLTTPHPEARAFDAAQRFRIERTREPVLLPTPWLARRIRELADSVAADVVIFDPVLPVGVLGPMIGRPYGLVVHGAEVAIPGRLPASSSVVRRLLRGAVVVVAFGGYPAAEAERTARQRLPLTVVPPGVDVPAGLDGVLRAVGETGDGDVDRRQARVELGLPAGRPLIVSVSRLVPRKGMDTLIRAVADPSVRRHEPQLAIAGAGRDRGRLERIARVENAPVAFMGRVSDVDRTRLLEAADVFAMLCRSRWGGLEQEGFGIVFIEAALAGVPQIAGRSGGSHEAVEHGVTGLVVDPDDHRAAARAIRRLLDDPDGARQMGVHARRRAVEEFDTSRLAAKLRHDLAAFVAGDLVPTGMAARD